VYDGRVGRVLLSSMLALAGCKQLLGLHDLPPSDSTVVTPDAAVDAIADAGVCVAASTMCLGDTLRTCSNSGGSSVDNNCAWGCISTGGARCAVIVPAGGGVTASDLVSTGLAPVTLATTTINTDTGAITGVRGAGQNVISNIRFQVKNGIGVFSFASLDITGTVTLVGSSPVALVADGDIVVNGVIDAQGGCVGINPGPGGWSGGQNAATGAGIGGGGAGMGGGNDCSGGGGGGNGSVGGVGGKSNATANTPGGVIVGTVRIPILQGGGGGGGGGVAASGGVGGGGGGAVQLVSNGTITIGGLVSAGGCGGKGTILNTGGAGGGGGAGGTILVEAVTIQIAATATLVVNGGGGGGGDTNGVNGANGGATTAPAGGGMGGTGIGGAGGAGGASNARPGAPGVDQHNGGGGGGAVGRMRFNTRSGTVSVSGSPVLSPTLGEPTTTAGAATTQ
jgi:hypothetical protein